VIGLPTSVSLTFYKGWGALGLWGGLTIAQAIMVTLMVIVVIRLPWQELADKARSRAREGGKEAEKPFQEGGPQKAPEKGGIWKAPQEAGVEHGDVEAGGEGGR
jgi:hypothetical protein